MKEFRNNYGSYIYFFGMLDSFCIANADMLYETKLNIKLTNKRVFTHGGWSKERILGLLKDKLSYYTKIKSSSIYNASFDMLSSIIHNGIYNECILKELKKKGMSLHNILKVMKHGLLSLTVEELKYIENFGVEMNVIKNADIWVKKLDHKLIWNLMITGLSEIQCWNIVMYGLMSQNKNILYRLLASGIDVPGILNWQKQIKPTTPIMLDFLKNLGIDDDTLHYVEKNGIDDKIEDMIIDLGYNEYEKEKVSKMSKEILCECNLTTMGSRSTLIEEKMTRTANDNSLLQIKKSYSCDLNNIAFSSNTSTSINMQYLVAPLTCTCHFNLLPKERNEALKRNDYLRQNIMVPLSWALKKVLIYQPSDPIYYIAHQLLRWRYGSVSEKEMCDTQKYIAYATRTMDRRLMTQHKRDKEDIIK